MFAGGRTAMIVNEMRHYKLSILGVSEVRWLRLVGSELQKVK